MSSFTREFSIGEVSAILGSIRNKGVKLWAENGQLHYRAPRGVLTADDIERIRASRAEIVVLLDRSKGATSLGSTVLGRPRQSEAPLAFTQLAYLGSFRLHGEAYVGRSALLVACAMRLHGPLDVAALQKSAAEVVRRHEALRTRVVARAGGLIQEIATSGECAIAPADLTRLSNEACEREVKRAFSDLTTTPIDVATDALFGVRLLKTGDNEHVLMIAMDHVVSDGTSVRILASDLLTGYQQVASGLPFSLPPVPVQFPDYSYWIRSSEKSWNDRHGEYWARRLAGCERLKFPRDGSSKSEPGIGTGRVALRIGARLKTELKEWCRTRRTTVVMAVFCAFVATVLRWCDVSESVFRYQTNGRTLPGLENTIGLFTSALMLRIAARDSDTLVDLLDTLTEEYCHACDHQDAAYLVAGTPVPGYACNAAFNWTPLGSALMLPACPTSEGGLLCTPIRPVHPILDRYCVDSEPWVQLYDADEEIAGSLCYPLGEFSAENMECFARRFLRVVESMVQHSEQKISNITVD